MTSLRRKRLLMLARKPMDHKRWYSQYCKLVSEGLVSWQLGFAFLTPLGEEHLKLLIVGSLQAKP